MKKITLAFFLIIETVICTALALPFYLLHVNKMKVLGIQNIVKVNDDNLIFNLVPDLTNYWELQPNTKEEVLPKWPNAKTAIYTYNADGLNDRNNYTIEKDPLTYRVIAIGESFTFGQYVSTHDSWPEKLEDKLNQGPYQCGFNKFEVLNLGMPGFDIPSITERYKRVGAKYQPDLIIWFESGTGFSRINELMSPLIKTCQKEVEEKYGDANKDSPEFISEYYGCWEKSQQKIKSLYTPLEIENYLSKYFNSFISNIDAKKLGFIMFSGHDDSILKMKQRLQNYPQVTLMSDVVFEEGDSFPDGHPSVSGHEKIMDVAEKMVRYHLSSSCL